MKTLFYPVFFVLSLSVKADIIANYMSIANNISQMEMKADPKSQAWAHSARNVLAITDETLAETLIQANLWAKQHNQTIFCLPANTVLNAALVNKSMKEYYRSFSSASLPANQTVSEIAWAAMNKYYSCRTRDNSLLQHVNALHPNSFKSN